MVMKLWRVIGKGTTSADNKDKKQLTITETCIIIMLMENNSRNMIKKISNINNKGKKMKNYSKWTDIVIGCFCSTPNVPIKQRF